MINHATIAQLHTDMHFSALNVAHITPEILAPVLEQILAYPEVTLVQSFTSFEQRPILHLRMGTGPVKILMWSQMHGDESTATAALMDFIHLLCRQTEYNFNDWQTRFTIDIVPMLNPDGAAKHTRVNGQFIDINRDALVLQSPEGRVLQHLVSSLQPDLALNLHDQNAYHGISERQHTSTIAMLAPVADHAKHITPVRKQAIGDDPDAAMLSGIKINRTLISVYALAGLICAFAGWVAAGRVGSISPIGFTDINLASITAVVIGGTSLFGGRGSILGSVLGAMIVGVFNTGLSLAGVDDYWQMFAAGNLVLIAVALDQWLRRATK